VMRSEERCIEPGWATIIFAVGTSPCGSGDESCERESERSGIVERQLGRKLTWPGGVQTKISVEYFTAGT
jgi:hypothetical protein